MYKKCESNILKALL